MNEHSIHSEFNRRDFLRGGSFAALATLMGGVQLAAQTAEPPPATAAGKIKVALIGLGIWGREILDHLTRLPQADVAVICDVYEPMVKRGARKAPTAATTADYMTILGDKDIKAVIVATPTHLHKAITLAALAAGKHVYCEAPLANTIEDTREIALAAKKASRLVFQPGLQARCDKQRHFLLPFIRSGALGKWVMARAQWNKKTSWRFTSPNADYEKAINWRLNKAMSLGLIGEIGIHQMDQVNWFFNALPVSITGFGNVAFYDDGREVADTVQASFEYPGGLRALYHSTLANSFDSEYEMYYGSDAAVMIRDGSAWMFKEADAPARGWEVYARKDAFYKETGISLRADASKLKSQGDQAAQNAEPVDPPIYFALQNFLRNANEIGNAIEDFVSIYGDDPAALAEHLAKNIEKAPAPDYLDGYRATVLGIKANEAIVKGEKVTLKPELFELA